MGPRGLAKGGRTCTCCIPDWPIGHPQTGAPPSGTRPSSSHTLVCPRTETCGVQRAAPPPPPHTHPLGGSCRRRRGRSGGTGPVHPNRTGDEGPAERHVCVGGGGGALPHPQGTGGMSPRRRAVPGGSRRCGASPRHRRTTDSAPAPRALPLGKTGGGGDALDPNRGPEGQMAEGPYQMMLPHLILCYVNRSSSSNARRPLPHRFWGGGGGYHVPCPWDRRVARRAEGGTGVTRRDPRSPSHTHTPLPLCTHGRGPKRPGKTAVQRPPPPRAGVVMCGTMRCTVTDMKGPPCPSTTASPPPTPAFRATQETPTKTP